MSNDKHWLQKTLESMLDDEELEGEIRSYSGRGMFGHSCLGFIPESINEGLLGAFLMDKAYTPDSPAYRLGSEVIDLMAEIKTDQLGRRQIWYWPSIKHVKD